MDELGPGAAAVDLHRLQQGRGNVGQPGKIDHHRRAAGPRAHQDQGGHRAAFRVDPFADGQAQGLQDGVEQAEIRIEHPHPQQAGRHGRDDGRDIEHRTEKGLAFQALVVQQQGNGQGCQLGGDHGAKSIQQRRLDGLPEEKVLREKLDIVLEPDKVATAENALVRKGDIQAVDKLAVGQENDTQQQRQHEKISRDRLVSPHG